MKKLLLFFVTLSMAVFASAQQLPDPGFEDWSGAKFANAEQPKYWNFSNVSQMGIDKNFAHKTTGRSGSALKIQDQRVGVDSIGTTSPGYVSLGKTWAFTSSDTAIEDATAGTCGGVQWKYRPDSMVVWIKRYYDSSAEGADGDHVMDEDFNILYYAWSGTAQGAMYKAKNGSCTNVYSAKPEYCIDEESDIRQALNGNECETKTYAKQIAEGWICDRKVYSDWTRIVVPIYYLNDDVPEKCNVILSAGNYPNFRANTGQYAGSTMDVDDISLVYSSKIQKLYINGREWKAFDPNSTEEQIYSLGQGVTTIPDIYAVRGAGSLTNSKKAKVTFPGRRLSNTECKIVKGQVDGEPTTITVTSEDGKSTTTYKIKFKSRNTKLADLKVNGTPVHGFNVHLNTFHYNVALPYGTTTIPNVTATAQDANATISITQANSVTGKATVLVTAADGTQQTYTITFFVVALTDVMLYVDGIGALDMSKGPNFTLNFPYGTKELNVSIVKKYEDQEVTILNNGVNEPTTITVKSFNPAEADKVYTITPKVIDYPDYSLTSVTVNGAPLANFNPNILTYIIPVTTTKPVLKYQHTGATGVTATTLQDNNKYTQVEVIDEYDSTRYYTFYYYYENDIIPNGDFTEYRKGLKDTTHTQMPVDWYGYADQYKEFKAFAWTVTDPGKEIFRKADGVLGISWGYWSALKGSAPLVLTLGSTDGFKYGNNSGSSASFSGGIPFRNTPDAADITYQLVDDEGLKSKFSFVFTDEQGTQTYDYIASERTSNYTTHRLPLATANKVIDSLNINIDASNGYLAGTDFGGAFKNYIDYGDVIYIDRIGFVYNSTLTELTVDGQTATLTDKNFAVDFSNSEMVLPALTFKGEVPDQMPVVTWSNAWTKSGAKATRTATIVNYAEDLSSTTYTLTVTRPTSANANCTYTLNGKDLTVVKGSPHQTIAVTTNDTAYVITVTAENGETKIIEVPYNKACIPYTYSVLTSDSTLGSVTITQEPTTCTEPLIFRADAAEGYQFAQWSDGNTDNPRSLILTQDTTITALFEQIVIEQDTIGAPSVKPVTSTEGYDFYVAFMPNGDSKPTDKDLKLQLFVNSREANRVRLEYADGSTKDYNVPAGGTTSIDVDPKKAYWEDEKGEEEKILDKGVRVYSLDKKPMTVYSGNQNGEDYGAALSFDGAHVLPKEALGQEYVIQSANDDYTATEFVVMSTRPGTTTVTVELNVKSRKGNKDRLTISFRKAKQIYIIRSKSIDPNKPNDVIDLSGSTICADAPVAVWSGNQFAIIPNQAGMTADHTYDQLLPVNRWGQEFIVPMTGMKTQMNELHIISLKESTNVTVSGVGASGVRTKAMGALEKWKKVVEAPSGENLLDSVFTITADKPIQVYLYTSSAASNIYTENGMRHFQGDPSMTMISPLEFVTDTTIFSTYEAGNKTSKHQLVLWAKQSVLGSLQLNGTAIGSQLTQAVPGMPEYRFARIDVTPGTYTLTAAERGFGGYVYGLGEGQAYLYPAGYTFKPYQDSLSLKDPNQEYPVFRSEWNEKYLNDGGWYLDKEEQKDGTYILDSIRVCDSTELTFPIKMYNEWDHVKWEIIGSIQGSEYFAAEEQYATATSKPELTHQFLLLPKNENKEPFEDFAVRAVVYHKPIMCDNIKQGKWPKDTLNTTVRVFRACIPYQDTIIVADSTGISDIIPDGQDTIPYIEVQPDGEITIDITDVRIGVITIVTIGTASGQVHPGFGGNYDELENTRVVMEYVLNPFGQTASPDKWYAFAVPFKVDMETGITRKYGNKSHVPGVDFMILEYDSELRSRTGSGWKEKKSGLLEPGHFYMLGIEGNCNRWLFEKVRDADVVGDKEKDLQHYAHGNSKNDGWHGLGNTTLEYVDMSFDGLNATYVYTYDNQYGRYNIYSIEESILAVGQPFFTQGDNDGSVAFTPNNGKGKGNGKKNMPIYAPSYDVQPSHPRVLLTIETAKINATPDRLYITLHDDNQCGSYRIGRDFMRMDKGSKVLPNFWCPMADGTQLSAHGVTMPTTYTTIPLGIFTPAKGEYTINAHMQDMDDYIVELYCQNICLGILMQGVPFRLEIAAGTSYDYSIRISRRVSTDLNPAEDTQCDKDNKWYDVLGRPLPQDAHGIFIRKGEKIIK